jgi:hypothetical protein
MFAIYALVGIIDVTTPNQIMVSRTRFPTQETCEKARVETIPELEADFRSRFPGKTVLFASACAPAPGTKNAAD